MINLQLYKKRIRALVWEPDISTFPRWKAVLWFALRMGHAISRDIAQGMITLRAMSLVYTTLLSLVPMLAVSFSVLKGFGVHNQIEPFLLFYTVPLGEPGIEISTRIIEFVDNMKVGVLGSLGLAMLLYTVISLIQKIETAFNYTWHVTQPRPLIQRFSNYLSVIMIGPVLIFSAIGISASMMSTSAVQHLMTIQPLGWMVEHAQRLLPYTLVLCAFTAIYVVVPNTKVRFASALVGAAVAALLWEGMGHAFASFVANSTKYTAIYSAFAVLIFFIIWIYLSWMILLIGASIAFYHQHPEKMPLGQRAFRLTNEGREQTALMIMRLIGQRYYHKQPAWTLAALNDHIKLPMDTIEEVLNTLVQSRLLAQTSEEPLTYLPAAPLEDVSVYEVLQTVRQSGDRCRKITALEPDNLVIDNMTSLLNKAASNSLAPFTLRDLALMDGSELTAPDILRRLQAEPTPPKRVK